MEGQLKSIPAHWWWAAGTVLFIAIASGFIAGFWVARMGERRRYDRARSSVAQLYLAIAGNARYGP